MCCFGSTGSPSTAYQCQHACGVCCVPHPQAQRLAAAESALRRSQPGATPGGAPDQAQKQADQLRRLAADVRSLKERLGGPGGLAGDGGRALVSEQVVD